MKVALVAAAVAVVRIAAAEAPELPKVEVELGKTVEQHVGYIRGGWFCDDATLVTAELVTRNDTNYWIVTGKKVGTTQCRVGVGEIGQPYVVYDVIVREPKKKKASK